MGKKREVVKPKTAKTRDEVARILDVHTRTVAEWIAMGCPARGPTGCTAFPKSSNGGKSIAAWSKPEHSAVLPHNWSRPENGIDRSDWPANGGMPHSWRSKTAVLGFGDGGGNCGVARIGKPHRHEEKTHTGFAKRGKTSEWVLPDRFPKRLYGNYRRW